MKLKLKALAMLVAFAFVLAGCGGQKAQEEAYAEQKAKITEKKAEEGHGHDDHHHDHDDHDHDHHHDPVHGGVLVELGDHVGNVEFLLGEDGTTLSAFVFDAHAEHAVRLSQTALELEVRTGDGTELVVLEGVANPLTGESLGDTSEFRGQVQLLDGAREFEAELKSIDYKGILFEGVMFSYSAENG